MMKTKPQKIELLAPAKDLETGIAAINCGADAVYIGAGSFGAREAAANSVAHIGRLADYAHLYHAKVYVTLNTLLFDNELQQAEELIRQAWDAGADAMIIQDMGILEMDLPPIPLFASTQVDNRTPEKVRFLEEAGFSRVILARELSLEKIRKIRAATTVQLEAFVHGALCVSYSGQCYMSYALGGRSGNRGRCAQPCRKRYDLEDSAGNVLAKSRYLLSLKDMDRSGMLEDMLKAGISSFKIEGRLKDLPYVVNNVSWYRQKLDALLSGKECRKASSGSVSFDFKPDPRKTFNRGYTEYGLTGERKGITSPHTPKAMGEAISSVKSAGKEYFILEEENDLIPGDGICFLDGSGELRGTAVNVREADKVWPRRMDHIVPGILIFRNYNHRFSAILANVPCRRTIDISTAISGSTDGLEVRVTDEDGITAEASLEGPLEVARDVEQSEANMRKQISKLGDTVFNCSVIEFRMKEYPFVPVSLLNGLRRRAVEALINERRVKYKREEASIIKNSFPYPEKSLTYEGNVLNGKAGDFYTRHGAQVTEAAAESGLHMKGRKLMTTFHCLRYETGMCVKKGNKGNVAEPLYLVDEEGRRFRLGFDCKECVMQIYME